MTTNSKKLVETIVKKLIEAGLDKKAENVISYDIQESAWITDYILVLSANNTIHCKALLSTLEDAYSKLSEKEIDELYPTFKKSGSSESGWFVVDLNSIHIHCVTSDIREFYELDSLFEKQGVTFHH
jgi:ribosome-associated protein